MKNHYSTFRRKSVQVIISAVFMFFCCGFMANAQCTSADPSVPVGIIPEVTEDGNPELCAGGYRINAPVSGTTYNLPNGGTVKVVLSSLSCGPVISWEASPGVVIHEIIVKGGPVANSYDYSGINPPPLFDGMLHAPIGAGPGGLQYYGVSHIDFCYTYDPPATLSCDVEVTDVTCFGVNDGTATAVPDFTGDLEDLTYEWSAAEGGEVPAGQENNKTITGLKPGVYIVTITDVNNPANPAICNEEISEPDEIILTCPDPEELNACSTDEQIKTAFDAWLASAIATQGENDLIVENDWDGTYPYKCGEIVTVKFWVEDDCADPCEATFTVLADEEAPEISTEAESGDLGCNPEEIVPPVFTGLDNCDGEFEPEVETDGPESDGCNWSQTWTANYTDECGNPAEEVSITYTWKVDEEAPVISTLAESDDLGCNPEEIVPPVFTGLDNCDGEFEPEVETDGPESDGCNWSQTWTANYTDECGNPAEEVSITYTWKVDEEAPVISTLAESDDLGCNPEEIVPPVFTGLDNCDGEFEPEVETDGPESDGCNWSQTWTANYTDECGNPAEEVSITYTWKVDEEAPELVCPDPVVVACGVQPTFEIPKAWDNCDGELEVTATRSDGLELTDAYPEGVTTITLEVEDNCGNPASCEFTVTVEPCACETAYARGDEAICFMPEYFANWGWTNPILPGEYTWDLWAAAGQCDTNNGTLVGSVDVVYDGVNVSVTYNVEAPYSIEETHTYVGTTMFPEVKRGRGTVSTVAPGSYYYAGPFDGGQVYVIAHAVVCGPYPTNSVTEEITEKSAEIVPSFGPGELNVYPNPFSEKITFEFVSAKDARARLEINNALGQRIVVLMDENVREGVMNRVEYRPHDVNSGILIYRLILDDDVNTGRLIYRK